MILISACLVGLNCKYNGKNNYNEKIFDLIKEGQAIPLCPEQLGGLMTPRQPAEIKIIDGKRYVYDNTVHDVTENFIKGANEVMSFVKKMNIKQAIFLQPRSPSCGIGQIYNGEFNGTLISGNGILVDMLLEAGVEVLTPEEFQAQEGKSKKK